MYGEAAINDYYSAYIALVINDRRKQSLCASTQAHEKTIPAGRRWWLLGSEILSGKNVGNKPEGENTQEGGV